jgi:hypothetical protein
MIEFHGLYIVKIRISEKYIPSLIQQNMETIENIALTLLLTFTICHKKESKFLIAYNSQLPASPRMSYLNLKTYRSMIFKCSFGKSQSPVTKNRYTP